MTEETKKEGSEAMSVKSSKEGFAWSEKTRTLAAGLLVAGMMAAVSLMPAPPADAATTFTVNLTADTPDANLSNAACDVNPTASGKQCTLRAAIGQANATAGADTIRFAIPGTTGVKTISPASVLPGITEQVTIDGYTQAGAHPNTKAVGNDAVLKIQLNGTNVSSDGLVISNSSSSVIKGLVINRFGGAGIYILGDSVGNHIEGNFIGTNPAGTLDRGNGATGVSIYDGPTREIVVGGTTPAARNVISGNRGGVEMGNDGAGGLVSTEANRIEGNYIGTDKSGTKDLGNDFTGIFLDDTSNISVGGTTAAARNVVSGNGEDGLLLLQGSTNALVRGNRIGTTADGTGALGNDLEGVAISGSRNFIGSTVWPNTIAFNGGEGINVSGGTQNLLDANSIFSNGAIGIDLSGGVEDAAGRTANDSGDADTGSNGLQNFPVITSAKTASGATTITGTLNSIPSGLGSGYTIQFFSNPAGGDEGKTFIGEINIDADASGNATFTFSPSSPVAVGKTITATAIAAFPNLSDLDTSEFSVPRTVASS
jgi:CSLREA domain-containing protein